MIEIGSVVKNVLNDKIGEVIALDNDLAFVQYSLPEDNMQMSNENAEYVALHKLEIVENI